MEDYSKVGLGNPFNAKGVPKKWVRILIPFLKQEQVKKIEIVKLFGVREHEYKQKRNICSQHLTRMVKAGILQPNSSGSYSVWNKGDNFEMFLSYIVTEITKNKKLRSDFLDMLIDYGPHNSMDLILKGRL